MSISTVVPSTTGPCSTGRIRLTECHWRRAPGTSWAVDCWACALLTFCSSCLPLLANSAAWTKANWSTRSSLLGYRRIWHWSHWSLYSDVTSNDHTEVLNYCVFLVAFFSFSFVLLLCVIFSFLSALRSRWNLVWLLLLLLCAVRATWRQPLNSGL